MKKTTSLLARVSWLSALCIAAHTEAAPKIQFNQTTYDFGKTSLVSSVTGVFTYTNTGDTTLVLQAPQPSCGCTVAALKPDTLAPGASGELSFTLSLGQAKTTMEKHISVKSNDPKTPDIALIIRVDFTPLYALDPMTISPSLVYGKNDTTQFTTLTRTDGKAIRINRLDASKPWIKATLEGSGTNEAVATLRIVTKRDGAARRFNEFVQIYTEEDAAKPATSLYVYGQVMGEVSVTPESLYWSIPVSTTPAADRPESLVLRRLSISSADGKALELKNPQSSIAGVKVQLVPKEAGKSYELIARLDDMPTNSIAGNITFDTSVVSQSTISVPIIVNVFKP
jgi:Protein of unknown function (DUF1573)